MLRKQFTREFKVAAVKQMESGGRVSEVSRSLGVARGVLHRWRREWKENPETCFRGLVRGVRSAQPARNRTADLERKVGQLVMEIDRLRSALEQLRQERMSHKQASGRRTNHAVRNTSIR